MALSVFSPAPSDSDHVLYVDTVADMLALTDVRDGAEVQTARYSASHTVGDGSGGEYVYDADSTATIDGGFVMPGPGGTLSFSGTTFNGTAGTGRWLLKDTTVANVMQFGAIGDGTTDDTVPIQSAINAVLGLANGPNFFRDVSVIFPAGKNFRVVDTLNLPTRSTPDNTSSTLRPTLQLIGYGSQITSTVNGPILRHRAETGSESNTLTYWRWVIEGFHFRGPYSYLDAGGGSRNNRSAVAIDWEDSYGLRIADCTFQKVHTAIKIARDYKALVENCFFTSCEIGVRGFSSDAGRSSKIRVDTCRFYSESPYAVAFRQDNGFLDVIDSIVEGSQCKYAVQAGYDSLRTSGSAEPTKGQRINVRNLHVEVPCKYVFRTALHANWWLDVDGLNLGSATGVGLVDANGSNEFTSFRFRKIYDRDGVLIRPATWLAGTDYAKGARVTKGTTMFTAIGDPAIGDDPASSTTGAWSPSVASEIFNGATDYARGDGVIGSDGKYYYAFGDPAIGDDPVGSTTGKWAYDGGSTPTIFDDDTYEGPSVEFRHANTADNSASMNFSISDVVGGGIANKGPRIEWFMNADNWDTASCPIFASYDGITTDRRSIRQANGQKRYDLPANNVTPDVSLGNTFRTANSATTNYITFYTTQLGGNVAAENKEISILVNDSNTTFRHNVGAGSYGIRMASGTDTKGVQGQVYTFRRDGTTAMWSQVSGPGSLRKELSDNLGNLGSTATINFDAATGDIKTATLTDDTAITLTATRPGMYWLLLRGDDGITERLITWSTSVSGSPPTSVTSTTYTVIQLFWDGATWHSTV